MNMFGKCYIISVYIVAYTPKYIGSVISQKVWNVINDGSYKVFHDGVHWYYGQ